MKVLFKFCYYSKYGRYFSNVEVIKELEWDLNRTWMFYKFRETSFSSPSNTHPSMCRVKNELLQWWFFLPHFELCHFRIWNPQLTCSWIDAASSGVLVTSHLRKHQCRGLLGAPREIWVLFYSDSRNCSGISSRTRDIYSERRCHWIPNMFYRKATVFNLDLRGFCKREIIN